MTTAKPATASCTPTSAVCLRVYRMTFTDASWRMWRDTPEFPQRFEARLEPDAGVIRGRWEKSTDQGATWEHDFNLEYIRERPEG